MIKAVIFDLNGIFVHSSKLSDRFEKDFNVPVAEFLPKLYEIMDKIRQPGAGGAYEYWKPALMKWGINMPEEKFWDYWFRSEIPSEEMIVYARELRERGIMVFILSNNFKERAEFYNSYPWVHEAADKAYFSWLTGFVKPNPLAWQLILDENNLNASECLYFDDQKKNVAAAENIGIKSFLFTSIADLKELVEKSTQT